MMQKDLSAYLRSCNTDKRVCGVCVENDILLALEHFAAQAKCRVGIGVGQESFPFHAVRKARRFSEIVFVGNVKQSGQDVMQTPEPERKLVEMLVDGSIDAAVRGTISAGKTLHQLKQQTGSRHICRSALLSTSDQKQFFLLPVGIDEGLSTQERAHIVTKTAGLLTALGVAPRVGVLSGGRSEDKGRAEFVDLTLESAEILTTQLNKAGIEATNYNILIEDAARSSNVIVAPDGVIGNLIFRTIVFLGGGKGHGAPLFGTTHAFVDTSRSGVAFVDGIIMASALHNLARNRLGNMPTLG
jgi:putative methanogen marker protein 4